MKYIKIVLPILVIIVGVLHITGLWQNMPILLLLLFILNIFNAWDSYKNDRKVEAVTILIGSIFIGFVAIYMLLS